ncbi:homeobox KN domain-containing protein [Geopyxis carbonaria]|nr:homeobox KN domain-containing protein [Geopyxis carbonaria]
MEPRPSPYIPVSSLTSSRGSSLDIETSERSIGNTSIGGYGSHPSPGGFASSYDYDARNPPAQPQDYNRYSSGSAVSPTSYRSSSPANQYSQPQYYSHSGSYSQPPRNQPGYSRQTAVADGRSPFSTPSHPVELSMDHFEQGRPGKRRRGNLPKHVTDLLRTWLHEHINHPYPTEDEKQMLMAQTGLTIHQISNWFINARRRRVPAMSHPDSKPSTPRRSGSGHQ